MSISKTLLATTIAAVLSMASQNASALDTSKITMRVRAINIAPADKSSASAGLLPKDGINVESKWAPDIDFEYAVTPNLGVELLLTVPQRHEVIATTVAGAQVNLGTVQHLPPTLTAKYYFLTSKVRPYLGAGVNFTWFTDDDLALGTTKLSIDRTSVGLALQAGLDVGLTDQWSLSFDAKHAGISTDVTLPNGAKVTTVKVDPYIYGAGVGYRF